MAGFDIAAFFDAESEAAIAAVWRAVQEAIAEAKDVSLGTRPHVTLGIYEVDLPSDASSLIEGLAKGSSCVTAPLDRVVSSTCGDDSSLYLPLQASAGLLSLHRRSFEIFSESGRRPIRRYWPASWRPHCTVAKGLPTTKIELAKAIIESMKLPDQVTLETIAVVEFRPLAELYGAVLGPDAHGA